jgi:hypothetical protein
MKFHRRMNLTALLVTIFGFRNKNKYSEFWFLTSQRYFLYKFRLKKDKPWVFLSKFRWRTILMHLLIPICGKFVDNQTSNLSCFGVAIWSFFFVNRCITPSEPIKNFITFEIDALETVGPVTLNDPGYRCFWSWWQFFVADQLRRLQPKTRSIYVFTFRETQNPDRLLYFYLLAFTLLWQAHSFQF